MRGTPATQREAPAPPDSCRDRSGRAEEIELLQWGTTGQSRPSNLYSTRSREGWADSPQRFGNTSSAIPIMTRSLHRRNKGERAGKQPAQEKNDGRIRDQLERGVPHQVPGLEPQNSQQRQHPERIDQVGKRL